jgi:hypothetical protein
MVNDADGDVLTDCEAEGDEADSADREADTLAPKVSDGVRDAERVPLLEGEAAATERERDAEREAVLEGETAAPLREALTDCDAALPLREALAEHDTDGERVAVPPHTSACSGNSCHMAAVSGKLASVQLDASSTLSTCPAVRVLNPPSLRFATATCDSTVLAPRSMRKNSCVVGGSLLR